MTWIKEWWGYVLAFSVCLIVFLLRDYFPAGPIEKTGYWPSGHISYEKKVLADSSISETYWYEIGQKMQETITSPDERSVMGSKWFANGQLEARGLTRDGKKQGIWMLWNSSGILTSKSEYFEDELHGLDIHYHDLGNVLAETNYKYGKKHGERRLYDYKGNLISVEVFDNDKLVSDRK